MITFLIIVVLIDVLVVIVFVFIDALLLFVGVLIMPQSTHLMLSRLPFLAKSILGLSHLIVLGSNEHGVVFVITLIIENFFLFGFLLLFFECFDDLILLLPTLLVLQIVHIEFVL
jgi:hypothetical protein